MTTIAPPRVGPMRRGPPPTPDPSADPPRGPRVPALVSLRYDMPRRRYLWPAALISIGFHALLFFGFNRPRVPVYEEAVRLTPEQMELFTVPPEEKPPERRTDENGAETEETDPSNLQDLTAAALPEPVALFGLDTVQMEITAPPPPVPPRPDALANFTIPHSQQRRPQAGAVKQLETFNLDQLDKKPEPVVQPPPNYPFELKRQGIEGDVLLRFIVDRKGNVLDPVVVRSSNSGFEPPAIASIQRWRFKAGIKNGRTVNTRMELSIRFKLEEGA